MNEGREGRMEEGNTEAMRERNGGMKGGVGKKGGREGTMEGERADGHPQFLRRACALHRPLIILSHNTGARSLTLRSVKLLLLASSTY